MMRQLLMIGLLALTFTSLQAQDNKKVNDKEDIQTALDQYHNTLKKKEYDKVIAYMPTEVNKLTTKNKLLKSVSEDFTYTPTPITIDRVEEVDISKVIMTEPDSNKYAKLTYTVYLHIKPDPGAVSNLSDEEWSNIERVIGMKYGPQFVNTMPILGIIEITQPRVMYAVNKESYKGWRLIEFRESTQDLVQQLVPAEVYKSLNK